MISELLKAEPFFTNMAKNYKALLEISSWIDYRKYQED